jgi:hypothetical protein
MKICGYILAVLAVVWFINGLIRVYLGFMADTAILGTEPRIYGSIGLATILLSTLVFMLAMWMVKKGGAPEGRDKD